jgi:hypothetical protein
MANLNIINFENPSFSFKGLFSRRNRFDKTNTRILFIDDEVDDFPVIQNLKDAGWSVEGRKDIQNIEDDVVKNSQIIFVDYKGVGQTLSEKEQGIGLIKLLKETYDKHKRVGLYSGHNRFTLGHDIDVADFKLPKNSDTGAFIATIQREIKKLK